MEISDIIGNKIKRLRIKKGFTQEELSVKLDIAREHLNKIENGKAHPGIVLVIKIRKIFKTKYEDILP